MKRTSLNQELMRIKRSWNRFESGCIFNHLQTSLLLIREVLLQPGDDRQGASRTGQIISTLSNQACDIFSIALQTLESSFRKDIQAFLCALEMLE